MFLTDPDIIHGVAIAPVTYATSNDEGAIAEVPIQTNTVSGPPSAVLVPSNEAVVSAPAYSEVTVKSDEDMSLKSALTSIGNVIGDIAKAGFNTIPLVPNVPASSFSSSLIGNLSNTIEPLREGIQTKILGNTPLAPVLKAAQSIVPSIIPNSSAIPTNGYVQNAVQGTVKPFATALIGNVFGKDPDTVVPSTIGIAQQSAAPVVAAGNKVQIPINSSGLGIFTQEVPPIAVTNDGFLAASSGLVGKAPSSIGKVDNLLPTSNPMEQIQKYAEKAAQTKNKPTNPSSVPVSSNDSSMGWIVGGVLALIGLIVLIIKR